MFKLLVFLSLFQLSALDFGASAKPAPITCPNVTDLQKTGQTSNTITYAWSNAYSGAQYRVWYTRQADGYTSSFQYTYSLSHTFTGLSAGHYTFYFQTLCGEESSNYIGVEDVIGG